MYHRKLIALTPFIRKQEIIKNKRIKVQLKKERNKTISYLKINKQVNDRFLIPQFNIASHVKS